MLTWQQTLPIADMADKYRYEHQLYDFPIKVTPLLRTEAAEIYWHDLPKKTDSICLYDIATNKASVLVNLRLRDFKGRMRFTLAHELGHLLSIKRGDSYDEELCDEFAACLLMPEVVFYRVHRNGGYKRCVEYFGVSNEAAKSRIPRLNDYVYFGNLEEERKLQERLRKYNEFHMPGWYAVGNDLLPEPWVGI